VVQTSIAAIRVFAETDPLGAYRCVSAGRTARRKPGALNGAIRGVDPDSCLLTRP
jgi:hypothetical protein